MWSTPHRLAALVAGFALLNGPAPATITLIGDAEGDEGDIFAYSVFIDEPGTDVLTVTWDFGDGSPTVSRSEETSVAHRFVDEGTFTVSVTAQGPTTSVATRMTVQVRGVAPVITVLSDHSEGQSIRFQADAFDPGDDELTYRWDFGDGSPVQAGVDRREVTHTYAGAGNFTTTLTVIDDDGLETVRVVGVEANPGFLGTIAGEVPAFSFAGASGKIAILGALPGGGPFANLPMFSGLPGVAGVADLSNATGMCLVTVGFWDDANKAHVNFQWTPDATRMFEPRMYLVDSDETQGGMTMDKVRVNALVLPIEDTYEKTRDAANSPAGQSGPGGLLGANLADLAAAWDADPPPIGPGRNWQLTSFAGFIETTRVTHRRIEGEIDARLRGAWLEADGSGPATYVEVKGNFSWELDPVARANILRCADLDFGLETHTPWVEEENVDFRNPGISLSLTLPYDRTTVNDQTFEVGWLDDGEGFHAIAGHYIHDDDEVTIHFVPADTLDDAVFYKARVRGGSSGIKSVSGAPLSADYEWRFSTFPDFVPEPGGGGGGASGDQAPGDPAPLVDPAPPPSGGPSATGWTEATSAVSEQVPVQTICDRVPESEWDTTPTVDLLVYQTSCNKRLVPGKPAVARIYLNWDYPQGKKGIDRYSAAVTMTSSAGAQTRSVTMKRQALYSDQDRRNAINSINVPFTPAGGRERIAVEVKATAVGPESPTPVVAKQVRSLASMSQRIAFGLPIIFPEVGSWNSGVPASVIARWTSGVAIAGAGTTFATQNLPVGRIQPQVYITPLALPDEPTSRRTVTCGPGGRRSCMNYRQYRVADLAADDWLESALIQHYTQGGAARPHVVLAVVPEDYGSAWGGITKHHVGLGSAWTDVRPRTPAVIFIKADMNPRTVAHELGHYMGLPHKSGRDGADRDPGIEGFRIESSGTKNKSFAEGNGESSQLISLMEEGDDGKVEDNSWILNDQYQALAEHLQVGPLWAQRPSRTFRDLVTGSRWADAQESGPSAGPISALDVWSPRSTEARLPHLLVSGWVPPQSEDDGHLYPVVGLDAAPVSATPGPYKIVLLDDRGAVLGETPFAPDTEYWSVGQVRTRTLFPFSVLVPAVTGVAAVRVVDPSGRTSAERTAGPAAPQVRFLTQGGQVWTAGGTVRWEGNDADGDAVSYSLSYRPDDTSGWVNLITGTSDTEFEPDANWLVPGVAPRLRLIASDGVHSTTIESTEVVPAVRVVDRWPAADQRAPQETTVSVSFNSPLVPDPGPDVIRVVGASGTVAGTVVLDAPDRLTFIPSSPLDAAQQYQVTVGNGLGTATGAPVPTQSWSFTTEADTVAPRIERALPRDGGISIPRQPVIYVWFSESMDSASVALGMELRDAAGGRIAGDFRYIPAGRVFVGTFRDPLQANAAYEVVVGPGVIDHAGNPVDAGVVSRFTTVGQGGPRRSPGPPGG